ncbi:hypothetical protein SAMN04487759_11733 [Kandleria vitulina]|uniref:DUF4190 domain-containing protein n=1 Tax=Kandleria vitulina TaxID=1630 RepID=A0A1H2U2B1_9FIRM|nr:hypothetical protein [Kandleria vitulina]SDL40221.1 hypothetical protein SAMN05216520_10537 [Kandleria vitulina]SDW49554.1 hypothetical protein SAMN04487759_11733 [Kandleria vitulina]
MAVASLVLGIIAIVIGLFTTGLLGWLGAIIGIVGIILGVLARKNNPSGIATAGFVCSIIGTVISLLFYLACVACLGAGAAATSSCVLLEVIL